MSYHQHNNAAKHGSCKPPSSWQNSPPLLISPSLRIPSSLRFTT
jgi:hypothetical protein